MAGLTRDTGMGGLWGGGNFLPTDPRGGKGLTGGSSKAAQYVDSTNIGYASKTAQPGYGSGGKSFAPDPYYQAKTAEERRQQIADSGIAPTHDNMGSLAVQFRANTEATHARGEMTREDKRSQQILGERAQDAYNFNVRGPARARENAQQARQDAQRAYLDKFKRDATGGSNATVRRNSSSGILPGRMTASGGSKATAASALSSSRRPSGGSSRTLARSGGYNVNEGLQAMAVHSATPYTQTLGR